MINIFISDKILIQGLTLEQTGVLTKTLTLNNPMFHKLRNMGKSVWGVPKEYKYWKIEEGGIYIPRGMKTRFLDWCYKKNLQHRFIDISRDETIPWNQFRFKGELRDYQIPIVNEVINHSEGVIKMGTGTGKTVVGLAIASHHRLRTTILVPNNVLLSQFRNACKEFFGYEAGIINGEEKHLQDVTIATYQSLQNNPILLGFLVSQTGTLIVDECQGAITDQRLKIVQSFMPKYLYGLTATPERGESDGRTKAIHFIFGNVIAEYNGTQCVPTVQMIMSNVDIEADEYHRMVENMVRNESRNTLIRGLIAGEVYSGRKVLVLTKRIEHYKILAENFDEDENFKFIESKDKERNELLERLRNGDEDFTCIFGTTSLLAVGTDIPRLDTLIIACDMKENTLTTQSAGRILRMFEGKPEPKIIDICDNRVVIFKRQARARKDLYLSKGWKVL